MLNLRKRSVYAKHRVLFIWAGIVVEVVLLAALAVLAIVVFGSIYIRVVEDPKFCGALCHEMEATYNSYKSSAHNGIRCSECHSEPGVKGFTKGLIVDAAQEVYIHMSGEQFYDMDDLHPKISDAACLRHECHKVETLVESKSLLGDDNIFSHRSHLPVALIEEHGGSAMAAEMSGTSPSLNCTSCHSQSKEVHMAVDRRVCFLCHSSDEMATAQECSSCHAIPAPQHETVMAGDSTSCADCHAVIATDITVPEENCAACHEGEVAKPLHAHSAHATHVGPQNARCMECHQILEREHGELVAHYDDNCQECHSTQVSMYQGTVTFVAEAMPSIKAESVDCSSCHVSLVENGAEHLDEIRQMCVECHEEGYDEMADGWQETIRDEIKEAEELLSIVAKELKTSADKPQKQKVSSLYKEARNRLVFVQKDGSSGVHNFDLADLLLTDAVDKLEECRKLLKQ